MSMIKKYKYDLYRYKYLMLMVLFAVFILVFEILIFGIDNAVRDKSGFGMAVASIIIMIYDGKFLRRVGREWIEMEEDRFTIVQLLFSGKTLRNEIQYNKIYGIMLSDMFDSYGLEILYKNNDKENLQISGLFNSNFFFFEVLNKCKAHIMENNRIINKLKKLEMLRDNFDKAVSRRKNYKIFFRIIMVFVFLVFFMLANVEEIFGSCINNNAKILLSLRLLFAFFVIVFVPIKKFPFDLD